MVEINALRSHMDNNGNRTSPPPTQSILPPDQPVVSSNSSVQPPVTRQGRGRKWLWIVAVIVVAALIAGAYALTRHKSSPGNQPQDQQQAHVSIIPDYGAIKVGDFAYVSACGVLSEASETNLFAGMSRSGLVQATYAENSLPASIITANNGHITSSCSRQFGSDTAYADTTLTFSIDEYPTVAAAKKDFQAFGVSQTDLDKANDRFGGNLSTDYAPLPGAANTIYSDSRVNSYTLASNKIFSFTASLADVSGDTFKQALVRAIPVVTQQVNAAKPDNTPPTDLAFGRTVGSSTILNPCNFFTGSDFQKATGTTPDPMNVEISYNYGEDQYFLADASKGLSTNSCARYAVPGTMKGIASMTAELHYYRTAADAATNAKQLVQKRSSDPSFEETAVPVNGLGDYAVYLKPTTTTGNGYLYVQKGAYLLVLHGRVSGGSEPSSNQYQQFAAILVPKFK